MNKLGPSLPRRVTNQGLTNSFSGLKTLKKFISYQSTLSLMYYEQSMWTQRQRSPFWNLSRYVILLRSLFYNAPILILRDMRTSIPKKTFRIWLLQWQWSSRMFSIAANEQVDLLAKQGVKLDLQLFKTLWVLKNDHMSSFKNLLF